MNDIGIESSRFNAFEKRILVAVSGLSPAILTETLYALAVDNEELFIPTEIHLITTEGGKRQAVNSLLKGENAAFLSLCREYELKNIKFDEAHIHVIPDSHGRGMVDIRKPEDNEAAADFISNIIFQLSRDDNTALHVSIAGGRKTMGYYIGYALSLFGREQDRLSHVLVDADYESCPTFFYPTKSPHTEINREDKHVDFSVANVYLAEIPFVRISQHLGKKVTKKDKLLTGESSFSDTVQLLQASTKAEQLLIDFKKKEMTVNTYTITWSEAQESCIVFYAWIIEKQFNENQPVKMPSTDTPIKEHATSFTEFYSECCQLGMSSRTENTFLSKGGMTYGFFRDRMREIKDIFEKNFGTAMANIFEITNVGEKLYEVQLDESIIRINQENTW